ncbi:MAG: NUDIX hydrolase [Brevinematia bacterium]
MNEVRVIKKRLIYQGKAFSFCSDEIEFNDKVMRKDYVLYPEAVAIVPVIGQNKFVLVRQFRYPVNDSVLEVPAGKLEPGESVTDGAIRELEEETGYKPNKITKLYEYYPAVGYSSEKIHIVLARDLEKTQKRLDEDEFTEVEILEHSEIMDMIRCGVIKDAKTIISFLLIEQFGGVYEI